MIHAQDMITPGSPKLKANPRVSWLIPVYNGENFLREALDSILKQSFQDFEIVVVNDGSADGTSAILAEYQRAEPRLHVLHQTNGGIVSALNAGLGWCRGEYVARLDADDICLPDRLRLQVDYLDRHPHCVLVGGYAIGIGRHCDGVGRTSGGRHSRTRLDLFPPRVAVAMHPLICSRRQALLAVGGYSANYPHAEDYDLFIRLAALGSIDNPPFDVLLYRRHEGAISVRNVELQERSAAAAERDARLRAGFSQIPECIFENYVSVRIFRRVATIDRKKAEAMLPSIVWLLLRPHPAALLSPYERRLRTMIAATLWRHLRRSAAFTTPFRWRPSLLRLVNFLRIP